MLQTLIIILGEKGLEHPSIVMLSKISKKKTMFWQKIKNPNTFL